jgi:hypothetical protein
MLSANVFVSVVTLASTLPLVFAGAVLPQSHDEESSIIRRQTSWDEYDQTTAVFAEQGLCRAYIDATGRDGLWPCKQYCKTDSVTCNGNANFKTDPSTIFKNPDGERYTPGECWCENPELLDLLVEFTIEGLQELPAVTCAVWLEALKQSVYLSTWVIPGAGPVAKAALTVIKSVKRAEMLGGKDGWTNFIKDTCHIDEWDFDISQAFDIFENGDEAQAKRI